jgi:molecular chaperone GrpE
MSDASSPLVAASPGERGAEAVNADVDAVEAILADFRAWLHEAREAAPAEAAPTLEVATVVQHFIALRQEVNLQTKASRGQLEQTGQALALLHQSFESMQDQQTKLQAGDQQAQDETLRPLLKTLIDAHDALALARREVQRLLDQPTNTLAGMPPPKLKIWVPYWARWLGLSELLAKQLAPLHAWHAAQTQPASIDESTPRHRQILDALLVGYQMSMQRIDRALEQHGLESIACAGAPFDPEMMEVAEVVREQGRAGTIVLDEIRRGYRWRGRLFRYAQVRVAKP